MSNHEPAFVSSFVIPEKRTRYAEFLAKPKRRGEVLNRFNHFFDFVPELATQVPRTSPEQLTVLLRQRGAPASAYLIGGPSSFDGSELPLAEAVDHAFCDQGGVVVSCLPGRLALYFQEFPPGDVFILHPCGLTTRSSEQAGRSRLFCIPSLFSPCLSLSLDSLGD